MKKKVAFLLVCVFAICFLVGCGQIMPGFSDNRPSDGRENGKTDGAVSGGGTETEIVVREEDVKFGPSNADGEISFGEIGYVTFGYYPQTVATKDALKEMSETTDSTGYYKSSYDNEYYAKISVANVYNLYEGDYEFSDKKKINARATYYFKVEPIKWRVYGIRSLEDGTRTLYLVSDVILDSSAFLSTELYAENPADGKFYRKDNGVEANNWAYSTLRKYLNGAFYKEAFGRLDKKDAAKIEERNVSTVSKVYDENDATEKVYALSTIEAKVLSKFLSAQVSDYARCRGTFMSVYPQLYGNGRYWLTGTGDKTYRAAYVSDDKSVSEKGESVGSDFVGVRPAIAINVESDVEIQTEEEKK